MLSAAISKPALPWLLLLAFGILYIFRVFKATCYIPLVISTNAEIMLEHDEMHVHSICCNLSPSCLYRTILTLNYRWKDIVQRSLVLSLQLWQCLGIHPFFYLIRIEGNRTYTSLSYLVSQIVPSIGQKLRLRKLGIYCHILQTNLLFKMANPWFYNIISLLLWGCALRLCSVQVCGGLHYWKPAQIDFVKRRFFKMWRF